MKSLIKNLPVVILYVTIFSYAFYGVEFRQRALWHKYNNMEGVITWVTFSPRSGVYLCGVKLADGTYGEVNNGSYPSKVGDKFVNSFYYSNVFGISGTAYCVLPTETRCLIEGLILDIFFTLPLAVLIIVSLYSLCQMWYEKSEEIIEIKERQKADVLYFKEKFNR